MTMREKLELLQQKRGTTYEEWMTFWHTRQSPMSEEIQPRARYVRNSVARAITPDAPPYLGIVEEAPVLPAVGARRVQAHERDAGAGLLDIEPVRLALDVET